MTRIYCRLLFIVFVSTCCFNNSTIAQTNFQKKLSLFKTIDITAKDSLAGFDEMFYKQQALADGFIGDEFYSFMYYRKREYIAAKYNLYQNQVNNIPAGKKVPGPGGNVINAAPCVNEDFELNSFSGWTVTSGNNSNSCAYNNCPVAGSPEAWIRSTPYADGNFPGGVLPNSPFGGTRVAQINDNGPGVQVTRLAQTFPVTGNNALFQYAYAAVFNGAHDCCGRPYLAISVKNCAGQVLACPQLSIVAPGGVNCGPAAPGFTSNGAMSVSLWQINSVDLTQYIGSCITIEITVGDCTGGAHQGYAYIDARCTPMNLDVNGNIFPAGTQAVTVAACGVNTAVVMAPPGLAPYNWNGPPGSGINNYGNQTFTAGVGGQYTLTMNPPGSCSPTVKYVTINFVSNPTAGITYTNACNEFTLSNTGSPAPAVQTYSFAGPGAVPVFTTTGTNTTVTFPSGGNYTITQVVTSTAGCTASTQVVVNVPSAPNLSFAITSPTQCLTGNSFTFTAADPAGVHDYTFNPPNGAPPPGNTPVYGPVQFTLAGTYTVTHAVTAGGCTAYSSAVVVVHPQPVATASNNSPVCLNTSIILNAGGGAAYAWSGPLGFTSNAQNPTINNASMGMAGQYSVTVTSAAGCTSTAVTDVTVLALPQPSITSNSPVCVGSTLSFTGGGGSSYSWTGPNGFNSLAQNPVISNVALPANGIYSLVVTVGACTNITTSSVTVNPLPTPTAQSNSPVCEQQQPINLTGSGGTTYTWTGPGGFISNQQNAVIAVAQNSNAGTYTLTVTNANNCTNSITTNVVISPPPTVVINNPLVCLNQNINLSSSGGNTYAWSGPLGYTSSQQNPVITNAQLNMSGAYVVTVTSAVGCTSSAVSNVTVLSLPQPTATSNSPVCEGNILSFTGSGGATYSWTGPNGFSSGAQNPVISNVSLAANGIYSLVVSVGTCTNITTSAVVINPLPTLTVTSNSPVCIEQPLNLISNGAATYTWAGPNAYAAIGQNQNIAVASLTNAGTYTLTATDVNNCVNSGTTSVVINPLPVITVNHPTNCIGTQIQLISNGANTYVWSGPLGFTSNAQNPAIMNAQVNMSGNYQVIGTSAQGCTSSAVANVSVSPSPTAVIASNSPVCFNKTLTFSGSGGMSYLWLGPNGFTSTAISNTIHNAPLAADGNYSLIVTVSTCTSMAIAPLVVNPLPTPSIQVSSPVCMGDPILFTGLGGLIFEWKGPAGFSGTGPGHVINAAGNLHGGVYSMTVTDGNGCVNNTTESVTVNPLPNVSTLGSTVCLGQTASLSVNSAGSVFSWSGPNNFVSTQTLITFPDFKEDLAGIYYVTVTGANQCTVLGGASVANWPAPTPSAENSGPVCLNEKVKFTSSGGHVYNWKGPNGFISSAKDTELESANSLDYTGTYTLGVIDDKGCQAFTTTYLMIRKLPTATVTTGANKFCVPFCSSFSLSSTSSLQPSTRWNMDNSGINVSPTYYSCFNIAGTHVLKTTFSDEYGCANTSSITIEAYPVPVADFHYGPGEPKEKTDVFFSDASNGKSVNDWTWYFAANNKISFDQYPSCIFEEPGTYPVALIVSNQWGCKDTIVKPVIIHEDFNVFVPNAFSPNADGVNDVFQPKGYGVTSFNMQVFDRWGEKLFQSNDINKGWDGYYKGDLAKDDAYVWKIVIGSKDGKLKEMSGTVTVVR